MSESFAQEPYSEVVPAFAYAEYSWDPNILAFFDSYNTIAQGYLTWFANTPLALYTSDAISGPLLDWTATGIYGISRPVLTTSSIAESGPLGTVTLGLHPLGVLTIVQSGTAVVVSDDIYKRILTWVLFRGDGLRFSLPWLLRRVERFLGGVNGVDVPLDLATRPTITVSGAAFSITIPSANPTSPIFQALMAQGFLPVPVGYTFTVTVA